VNPLRLPAPAWPLLAALWLWAGAAPAAETRTVKPMLHGQHWIAITGKPLAATAGARTFLAGGNAVDAACAMLAATATMFDVLSWGGETQALIYHPGEGRVIGINALGVAPSGATPEFFRDRGLAVPPEYGPLAAVTPGTPGGLLVMLAEYGTLSLAEVLGPAIELADGYPMEAQTADSIEHFKEQIRQWPESRALFLVHEGEAREAPRAGELFRQPDLARTLRKLLAAEAEALAAGANRREAISAAYDRFYRGDIAAAFVAGSQALGGLHTLADLADWRVHIEAPVHTRYKGVDVYKLTSWVQGPVMLQALNMLEPMDLRAMGYNSARYIHTLYQVFNLAFADRDFYYGDPYFPPQEPMTGLLSKDYARARAAGIDPERNDPLVKPGNPYKFQAGEHPFPEALEGWTNAVDEARGIMPPWQQARPRRPRPGFPRRHHVHSGRRCAGLGGVGDPQRRLDPGGRCRRHGHRHESAHAELRARSGAESLQRGGAGETAAGHADAGPRPEGRQALSVLRRAGRRYAGSESHPVLPQRRGIRHERPAGRGGAEFLELPAP